MKNLLFLILLINGKKSIKILKLENKFIRKNDISIVGFKKGRKIIRIYKYYFK
jgi:hypothetical protein